MDLPSELIRNEFKVAAVQLFAVISRRAISTSCHLAGVELAEAANKFLVNNLVPDLGHHYGIEAELNRIIVLNLLPRLAHIVEAWLPRRDDRKGFGPVNFHLMVFGPRLDRKSFGKTKCGRLVDENRCFIVCSAEF